MPPAMALALMGLVTAVPLSATAALARFTTFNPPRVPNVFCWYFRSRTEAPADGRVATTTMLPADKVAVTWVRSTPDSLAMSVMMLAVRDEEVAE
jgi:hypothetical protein